MSARLSRSVAEPWLVWLLTGFMLNAAGIFLLRPMISYKALALGVEPANLGLVAGAFSLAPLAVALRVGRLIDRPGEKAVVMGGSALMAATLAAIALVQSVAWVAILSVVLGLGHLSAVVATQGLVARGSDESSFDRRFVAFSFAGNLGQLLGPALGGLAAGGGDAPDTTRGLLVGAVLLAAVVPLTALVRLPAVSADGRVRASTTRTEGGVGGSLIGILRTPGVLRAIVVGTVVISSIDILTVYLPAIGEERAWSIGLVGALLALRAGASLVTRFYLAGLVTRFGRGPMLAASMAVSAVALLLMPAFGSVPVFAVLMVVAGAGLGIGQPLCLAWVASVASPETRATALAVRLMGNRLGQVALPVAAGAMAAFSGAGGVLAFTGLVVGVSLAGVYGGLGGAPRAARTRPMASAVAVADDEPAART
jgi:MFS family permease